jgi:tRNA_anti-like
MVKKLIIFGILVISAACGGAGSSNSSNTGAAKPMLVGELMAEYKKDKEATVKKYTGKTLTIAGYTTTTPLMPTGATDDGILIVHERDADPFANLTCRFKAADKTAFSKITADEAVIVKGVFDDSSSTALNSCQIVDTK